MGIFVMIVILGLIIPFVVGWVKKLIKGIPEGLYPLLPFIVGLVLGLLALMLSMGPKTVREAVLLGVASGGMAISVYDIYNGLKSLFVKPEAVKK